MTYQKPEVVPLGHATMLIKGGKRLFTETMNLNLRRDDPDGELDD